MCDGSLLLRSELPQWYPKQNSVNSFHPPNFLVPQNFWAGYAIGFIVRLLRPARKVLGSQMRLSETWF